MTDLFLILAPIIAGPLGFIAGWIQANRTNPAHQQNQRDADALNAYLESRLRHPSSRYYMENHHDD